MGYVLLTALDPEREKKEGFRMKKGRIVPSEKDTGIIERLYERYSRRPEKEAQAAVEKEQIPATLDIRKRRSGMLKGLLFHKALEISQKLPSSQKIDELVGKAMLMVGSEYTEDEREAASEGAKSALSGAVTDKRLERYFTPDAVAEVETLSGKYPNLMGRADRVVFGDSIEIIDFKTDDPGQGRDLGKLVRWYAPQVEGYCRSFANLFPGRRIEGWLYFTEAPLEKRLVKVYEKEEV